MKKQKSGLYRTKVRIGYDQEGKPIDKWISGKTKRELEDAKRAVRDTYILGDGPVEDQLFGAYATKWYTSLKASTLSASSLESYRSALNHDILPVFGDFNLRAIRPTDLQAFLDKYAGKSQTKISYIRASLRKIFAEACIDRILDRNPMNYIRKPKAAPPKEKRALTEDERAALVRVCATHPQGAYLAVMYYLGVRPGEARGLRWGDFAEDLSTVHIQRDIDYKDGGQASDLKTQQSDRVIPVPSPLRDILAPLRGAGEQYLFRGEVSGTALAKTTGERLWTELMLAAGMVVPAESPRYGERDIRSHWTPIITPHVLRHNYITICWENGLDPYITMRLAGHKSIKTTMDIYTHLSTVQAARAAVQVEAMFAKGAKSCTKVAPAKTSFSSEEKKNAPEPKDSGAYEGDPSGIRTPDTLIKRQRQPSTESQKTIDL